VKGKCSDCGGQIDRREWDAYQAESNEKCLYSCNCKIYTKEVTLENYKGPVDKIKMENIEIKS